MCFVAEVSPDYEGRRSFSRRCSSLLVPMTSLSHVRLYWHCIDILLTLWLFDHFHWSMGQFHTTSTCWCLVTELISCCIRLWDKIDHAKHGLCPLTPVQPWDNFWSACLNGFLPCAWLGTLKFEWLWHIPIVVPKSWRKYAAGSEIHDNACV